MDELFSTENEINISENSDISSSNEKVERAYTVHINGTLHINKQNSKSKDYLENITLTGEYLLTIEGIVSFCRNLPGLSRSHLKAEYSKELNEAVDLYGTNVDNKSTGLDEVKSEKDVEVGSTTYRRQKKRKTISDSYSKSAFIHPPRQKIHCVTCGFSCSQGRAIVGHMKNHDHGKATIKQSSSLMKISNLNKVSNIPKRSFVCYFCGQSFVFAAVLKSHLVAEHKNVTVEVCKACSFSCEYRHELNTHINNKHKCKEKYFCFSCEKFFENMNILSEHFSSNHRSRQRVLCSLCLKSFNFVSLVKQHIVIEHLDSTTMLSYKCGICSSVSYTKYSRLLTHYYQKHCTDDKKPFLCSVCGKSFATKAVLGNHQYKHSSERPFHCDECSYQSKTKAALTAHKNNKHSTERPYSCEYCGLALKNAGAVKAHIFSVHSSSRPFKCSYCPYSGKKKHDLVTHIQGRHSNGATPFHCLSCSFAARTKTALSKHNARHHEDRKIVFCPHCAYSCKLQCDLNKHIRRVHLKSRIKQLACVSDCK